MKVARRWVPVDRAQWPTLAGGLASVVIAAVVYGQFSVDSWLKRDSAIYMYGGQQLLHDRPPYVSIMDPKGPLAGFICGLGSAVARMVGGSDVTVDRLEFFVIALLTVVAVYAFARAMTGSVIAALVGATIFVSFEGLARDALAGPNGHTPGILFSVVTLWLVARKHWFWAGIAASLAFLDWQPLFPYALVAVLCAAVWTSEGRRSAVIRVVVGGVAPLAVVTLYYAVLGDLHALIDGLFVFPLTGVVRDPTTLGDRIHLIFSDIHNSYGASSYLLWIGIVLLLAVTALSIATAERRRDALTGPLVLLVLVSFVSQVLYAVYDYQGYSHAFPLLVYGALGFAVALARLLDITAGQVRRATTVVVLVAVAVVTVAFTASYHRPKSPGITALGSEKASACAIAQSLAPGTPLWVMGNPLPLVLLHRRNPDNYPYLGSGLDIWRIDHTHGGFDGWGRQVLRSRASVIVVDVWQSPVRLRMQAWLSRRGFTRGYIGPWQVFVTSQAATAMTGNGIKLTPRPHFLPRTTAHSWYKDATCSSA